MSYEYELKIVQDGKLLFFADDNTCGDSIENLKEQLEELMNTLNYIKR